VSITVQEITQPMDVGSNDEEFWCTVSVDSDDKKTLSTASMLKVK
jgi:hypothetical protein